MCIVTYGAASMAAGAEVTIITVNKSVKNLYLTYFSGSAVVTKSLLL